MTEDEILADFPDLERDDICAALALAADRERRLIADPAAWDADSNLRLFDLNLSHRLVAQLADL